MNPKVTAVKPLPDYELLLTFENEEQRIYDVKPMIKGTWMGQLKDPSLFATVHIGGISIEWDGGQDLCPDDLYENSRPVTE